MRPLSFPAIAAAFEPQTLQRGQRLHAERLVVDIDKNADGNVIVGRVRGSAPRPYTQFINIRHSGAGIAINGVCSCPVQNNCKHVVAVLIEALHQTAENGHGGAVAELVAAPIAPPPVPVRQLPPALSGWLSQIGPLDAQLAEARPADANAYPSSIRERLLYVLSVDAKHLGTQPNLQAVVVSLLRGGGFGSNPRTYDPENIYNYKPAKHLRPVDLEILRELAWLRRHEGTAGLGETRISDNPMLARLLPKILATGRCHWRDLNGPVLSVGEARVAQLAWQRQPGGRQRLSFALVDGVLQDAAGSVAGNVAENAANTSTQVVAKAAAGTAMVSHAGREPETGSRTIDCVLPMLPPHYVDIKSRCVGAIEIDLPGKLATLIAGAPDIASADAPAFAAALEQRLHAAGLAGKVPLPESDVHVETRRIKPTPRLELFLGDVRLRPQFVWHANDERHRGQFKVPLARLMLDYDGVAIEIQHKGEMLERLDDKRLILTPRDHRAELAAAERLAALGLAPLARTPMIQSPLAQSSSATTAAQANALFLFPENAEHPHQFLRSFDDPARFLDFSAECIPELLAEGWEIAYSADYPYQIVEGDATWWADIGEGSGIDWLSFELGIDFDGHRIDLVPHLTDMIAGLPPEIAALAFSNETKDLQAFAAAFKGGKLYHTLPDGRLLPLPGGRLVPLLRAMLELVGPRGGSRAGKKMAIRRADAVSLAGFADAVGGDIAWAAGAEKLIALGRNLQRGRGPVPITPPASFKASLRPYQLDGLAWLAFLREMEFGGALADDMGLGKTVQALAFIAHEKAEGRLDKPALIVAPTSVLPNWQAEAERFTPDLKVLALRGLDRQSLFGSIDAADLVLTTYPLLLRDHGTLLERTFHIAILDEAQAIKNPKSNISGIAHRINARHRLALTGTPLENNLGEVWSLFEFLSPGLLGDESTFKRVFRTPIEKHGDKAAQAFLTRRLKPFMLRRTKAAVAPELPPKTEVVERIRLEGGQRDLYETVRSVMHAKVRAEIDKKGLAKSHIVFLDALLKLRQVCCDPRLLKMSQARKVKESAKLERLLELLPEFVDQGRRVLLFSQFTTMLGLIETELKRLRIPYVMLTGDTTDRATPVKHFQAGKVPLFLLSLKAGGTGLNLTAADTVVHYDPWWNPAVENQATDRAYRIGQDKPVFVHKLIVEEGIEEAIELLKLRKAALAEALFEGASKSGLDLSEADISALFAPLDRRDRMKRAA